MPTSRIASELVRNVIPISVNEALLNVFITHPALLTSTVGNFDAKLPVHQNQDVNSINQFQFNTQLLNTNNFFSYFVHFLGYNWITYESSFFVLDFLKLACDITMKAASSTHTLID